MSNETQITTLLREAESGNTDALDQAITAVYDDLKLRARKQMRRLEHRPGMLTLQPTALINETYMRLLKQRTRYSNQGHFLAIATRVMLRVIADHERKRKAQKRGGEVVMMTLSGVGEDSSSTDVEHLTEALDQLEALDERKADVVKLKAIWGYDMPEIAESLNVSLTTVERDWRFARSWLAEQLQA